MSLSHTEDLLSALESYTESNLGARLTAITTDKGDSVPLPNLNDVLVGTTSLEGLHNWPLGFVVPVTDSWEMITTDHYELTVTVDFWIVAAGYAEDTLYTQLLRYAAGVFNMVDLSPDLGDSVGDCRIETVEYYPRIVGVDGARAARLRIILTDEV